MTNNAQPEALRLADDLEASSLFPGNMRCCNDAAAELRRQHARIAELEAQIESVSAAQAVPNGDELRRIARSARTSASDDASPTEYVLAGWKSAMRATSPPPHDGWWQSGALLYRLEGNRKPRNRDEIRVTMADGSHTPEACARRAGELLDRIRAAPQQEAPKAAPVDEGKALAALRYYMNECSGAEPSLSVFHRMVEEALGAAPEQEVQEPALFIGEIQLADLVDPPYPTKGIVIAVRKTKDDLFSQPLYTAPQAAPAPLSDDTERLREALQRIEGASMSMYATRSDMLEHCQDIARAALAAQGGKDAK